MASSHDSQKLTAAERTRRSILKATLELIGAGGPDAVTHRAVASRAKIPVGSVTYHFESRDRLIIEAFRALMGATRSWLEGTAQQENLIGQHVTVADIVNAAALVVETEFEQPDYVRAEYELILYLKHSEDLKREFLVYQRAILTGFAYLLELLGAPHPFDAARTVVGLVRNFELERIINPEAKIESFRRRLEPVVRALVATDRPQVPGGGKPPGKNRER